MFRDRLFHILKTDSLRAVKSHPVIPLDSVENARKILLGTWTYTQPIVDSGKLGDLHGSGWIKIVFTKNHCLFYQTSPTASDWGKPSSCRWKAETAKYSNTGTRFYYTKLKFDPFDSVDLVLVLTSHVRGNLSVAIDPNINPVELVKADVFPFSK
jgi:hypothetical protein